MNPVTRWSLGRILRGMALAMVVLAACSVVWVLTYRVIDPPATLLMLLRGGDADRTWMPLDRIAPQLADAAIAAEDARFCEHHGFDWVAMQAAWEHDRNGGRLRGGSTISMQTAKNAFLWPGRSYLRKAAEAWFTFWMEALWPKSRIIEVYLNIVEWGDGVYGAEAAARHHVRQPAARLSAREAALLAAVLPDPRAWSPERPTPFLRARAATIMARMAEVRRDGLDRCAVPAR